jgi:hypothetical protein
MLSHLSLVLDSVLSNTRHLFKISRKLLLTSEWQATALYSFLSCDLIGLSFLLSVM